MPPTDGRSDVKTVAFQCFAEEWDQIVAASEIDRQSATAGGLGKRCCRLQHGPGIASPTRGGSGTTQRELAVLSLLRLPVSPRRQAEQRLSYSRWLRRHPGLRRFP